MMQLRPLRTWLAAGLAALAACALPAAAVDVTITVVATDGSRTVPLESRQALAKSPFGGWVVAGWPFWLQVDQKPILKYQTHAEALMGETGKDLEAGMIRDAAADAVLEALDTKKASAQQEEAVASAPRRKASERVSLDPGTHTIQPFAIAFTVAADGTLATPDPRLRVDAKGGRVELVCWPVTFKTVSGDRSVPAPLAVGYGDKPLLQGIGAMLAEFEKGGASARGDGGNPPAAPLFRRVTLYLPASVPGEGYQVNGVSFQVGTDGRVILPADAKAICVEGREIRLRQETAPAAAARPQAADPLLPRPPEMKDDAGKTVWIGAEDPKVAVSFFTFRNRGVWGRGDVLDILWSAKGESLPGGVPIGLRGAGIETKLGALPGGKAGGCISLDTAPLAPGIYEIDVKAPGVACWPLRFRVCQREPVSDYQVYSYVYGLSQPCGGSPVSAYYDGVRDASGLAPFLPDTDASLDPSLAKYADSPLGPAPEKFVRPGKEEQTLMALAGLGMRAVPAYPTMLYHEDWNPKHTLPEELAQMRRRLALFVQPLADVAGLGGITMGWYATVNGSWWEDVPCQDGNVVRRNAAAEAWVKARVAEAAKQAEAKGLAGAELEYVRQMAEYRARSSILPNAWAEYLADVRQMAPWLSSHNAIPSDWLARQDPGCAFSTLTHRDAVDYSDYGITAWGNFRTPAWLNIGNRDGQKLFCNFMANQMHNRIVTAFGATGRGLDGLSMPVDGGCPQGQDEALRRIFERFGSWFSALEPLPDVALYCTDKNPQNVALHDLARMRRPAMLLGPDDVLAGNLAKYRVLFLVSAKNPLPAAILGAFRKFEAAGGIIVKDRTCHASLPGRDLGFGYEGAQVHPVWGLAYANGEDEFAHLWKNFKATREKFLLEAFAKIPGLPVTTADPDAVISPLAGKDSICCFVMNQALVPLSLAGRWRQYFVLPKNNELLLEKSWHVRDLLGGRPASMDRADDGRQKTAMDFTRAEGAIFLLTKREPRRMAMRTERSAPETLRLTAWLADAADQPLADPMPFEVTLRGPEGAVVFHKFAALGPDEALDVPVPARSAAGNLQLAVRDLVLGSTATQALEPAAPASVVAGSTADLIGGSRQIARFLAERKGPVTILLDEGQDAYRPAAEQLAALLKKKGREGRIIQWDPADVPALPLRWHPTEADRKLLESLAGGNGFVGRVALKGIPKKGLQKGNTPPPLDFDNPECGYDEYGPRLRHDADIVLFGSPETNLALAQLVPYLRRVPSESYPAAGGFFLHYLWSPFQGGYDGLYVGCRDAAGALAAVATLAELKPETRASAAKTDAAPSLTQGEAPVPCEDMLKGKFGRPVLDIAFTPDGKRIFAITAGLGKQLFALAPDGKVEETRELHHGRGKGAEARTVEYQGVQAPLKAIDERTAEVGVGDIRYRFSLDKGFLSRRSPPLSGLAGKTAIRAAIPPVLEDTAGSRVYLGGRSSLHALDGLGRCLWAYDDEAGAIHEALLRYPRHFYPRAVSGNGKVLLVSGFGSREMVGPPQPANEVLFGFDSAIGRRLWQKKLFLNEGSVVHLDDRFLVFDDAGAGRVFMAADGAEAGQMQAIKGSARIRPVPGRDELLIIDNDAFDRNGPTARVVLRPIGGGADRELSVPGRVTDAQVMADGQSVLLATARGVTLRLATSDGHLLWRSETPSGGILRLAPDGSTVWVGACDGVIHRLEAATGKPLGTIDLNPYNVTTPEHFAQQMEAIPVLSAAGDAGSAPPMPVAPSYRATLDPKNVPLGRNLLGENVEPTARPLAPDAAFKLQVEAGKTYLVELLAAAAEPAKLTPVTRLEISVAGARKTVNLPYVGRLPLTASLARRRLAFRADEAGEVTLSLRAVEPVIAGEEKKPQASYEKVQASPAGLLAGDLFVGAINFKGPNLLLEGGPQARRAPAGDLKCTVFPWSGGSHLVRTQPYDCVQSALRMVNGRLAGENSVWGPSASGADLDYATGVVHFKKPRTLTAIAIYEDNSGPLPSGEGVVEKVASRYGVYVRKAGAKELTYVGHVSDNTQLVNIFACPPFAVDEVHYVWAGRTNRARTDGPVRMAEVEAYADEVGSALGEFE